MQASAFDEPAFFRAIADSGARALLIGRQALIALGMPVMTADYDFWLDADDIVAFNDAVRRFDMFPNRSPEDARARGRYVLENDEHVDVLVAPSIILTKRFGARPRDADDIRWLELLRDQP